MVDFNGFDKGVIGKKLPSDSTLNQMKKSELIELLHLAESNHRVLAETYKIAVDTSKCKSCPLTLDEKDRRQVRTEVIDEFVSTFEKEFAPNLDENLITMIEFNKWFENVTKIAEQFKEQKLCSNGKPCKHPKCNKCGTTHFMSECDYGKERKE